ncbi:hypothetical protein LDENG_00016850 [Lucifuga dentata]|nr:hypothetical protein LDENG_00016850 [Lucifuga dentata]
MAKNHLTLWISYSPIIQAGLSDPLTRVCWSFLIQVSKLKVREPLSLRLLHSGILTKLEINELLKKQLKTHPSIHFL